MDELFLSKLYKSLVWTPCDPFPFIVAVTFYGLVQLRSIRLLLPDASFWGKHIWRLGGWTCIKWMLLGGVWQWHGRAVTEPLTYHVETTQLPHISMESIHLYWCLLLSLSRSCLMGLMWPAGPRSYSTLWLPCWARVPTLRRWLGTTAD